MQDPLQSTVKSISLVSIFFVMIFGGLHISSTFLLKQGVQNEILALIRRSLDLPFLFPALVYGTARASLMTEKITGNLKNALVFFGIASSVLLTIAIIINFGIKDAAI